MSTPPTKPAPQPRAPRPKRSGRTRIVVAAVLAALIIAAAIAVVVWTDAAWFASLHATRVFTTQLVAVVGLTVAGALLMGAIVGGSVALAVRWRPTGPASNPVIARARGSVARHGRVLVGVAAVLAGFVGATSASQIMPTFLAWTQRTSFGVQDPTFHLDASFYVFDYPWYRFVVSFVSTSLVLGLIAAGLIHYVLGGLGARRGGRAAPPTLSARASGQLSITAALIAVCFGLDSLLDRVSYPITTNALLTGVTYTDDHARITAHLILAIIAFGCAGLFVANLYWRRWMLPGTAVALAIVSSLVLSTAYPGLLQAISVRPSEPQKEAPYMARNIAATRQAYGISDVSIQEYSAQTKASAGQLRSDAEALPGIRLIDPAVVSQTYDQLQQVRGYYTFPAQLDVDRYRVDGEMTDAVVAAREIDSGKIPNTSWNNVHTVYTHGYGLVAAYGNKRQAGGQPDWLANDIPPVGQLHQQQSRVYFGELEKTYVIVGARPGQAPIEFDTPGGGQSVGEQYTTYSGTGGIPLANPLLRAAFAARLGDVNLLLSDRVHANSQLLYDRAPADRVRKVAPWLTIDSDPFPTLVDGRLTWVLDGYTTTSRYPNSQRISLGDATHDVQTRLSATGVTDTDLNYIRNSVKATVDAYDGSVHLYAWDPTDPILQTWRKVYPGLVEDRSAMSSDLLAHVRYPEDLFKVQREILGRYHMTDTAQWYEQSDQWMIPADPVAAKNNSANAGEKESTYYLSIKWPGDPGPVFSQTSVVVPKGRTNLAAYLAVNSDATSPDYGKLRVLRMSDTQQIDGPGQAFNAMTNDEKVAERLRPYFNQGPSSAIFGNLLTIPLGGGLLYVTPVYTKLDQGGSASYPSLRFVIVRFGSAVAIGDTLQSALDTVFQGNAGAATKESDGTNPPPTTTPPGDTTTPGSADPAAVKQALADAERAFTEADAALKAGDLATYQKKIAEAQAAVERAQKAQG